MNHVGPQLNLNFIFIGLALNLIGSILLGVAGVKGRASWLLGWLLLAVGFALQWLAVDVALMVQTAMP